MDLEFKKWQDFNNLSVKVTINKKIFDAILHIDNNRLTLKINMTKNLNEWRKLNTNYDIISGKFLFNNQKIFFINCIYVGHKSSINCKNNTIDNIETVYNNFIKQYNQLYPLIEVYYNVTQYNIPNLTRFINATTMLEYYSRSYDSINSLTLSKNINPKRHDPYYECMVLSLINNVNEVFNCTTNEIDKISQNIKAARIHYIHYKTNQNSKILTDDEQFRYSYFMQDVVLLNIYKLLGLNISKYKYISFNNFFYNIKDLL